MMTLLNAVLGLAMSLYAAPPMPHVIDLGAGEIIDRSYLTNEDYLRALIKNLGHDKFAVRQSAHARIMELLPQMKSTAVGILVEGKKSNDPEIRYRVDNIAKQFSSADFHDVGFGYCGQEKLILFDGEPKWGTYEVRIIHAKEKGNYNVVLRVVKPPPPGTTTIAIADGDKGEIVIPKPEISITKKDQEITMGPFTKEFLKHSGTMLIGKSEPGIPFLQGEADKNTTKCSLPLPPEPKK